MGSRARDVPVPVAGRIVPVRDTGGTGIPSQDRCPELPVSGGCNGARVKGIEGKLPLDAYACPRG